MPLLRRQPVRRLVKSSSSDKTYQTLLYDDQTTSCDCPGWTRRIQRSCRHTRSVDLGTADTEAINFHEYGTSAAADTKPASTVQRFNASTPVLQYGNRKLYI